MQPGAMAVRLQSDKLMNAGLSDFSGPIEYKSPQNFVICFSNVGDNSANVKEPLSKEIQTPIIEYS